MNPQQTSLNTLAGVLNAPKYSEVKHRYQTIGQKIMKMRAVGLLIGLLLYAGTSTAAQVSLSIGLPNVRIGINLPVYPDLVVVPGYPVYYAPRLDANYFFYDGLYWVYQDDNWYASSWYNGPWSFVEPEIVPVYILRVPVRYYRQPPRYFRAWRSDGAPRWGEYWGRDWEQHRHGWDQWNRRAAPAPAPLPVYQRQYSRERYPAQVEQQQVLQQRNYRHQSRDPVIRQHTQERAEQRSPEMRRPNRQESQQSAPRPQEAPALPNARSPQRSGDDERRSVPTNPQQRPTETHDRKQQSELAQPEQQRSQGREEKQPGKDAAPESNRGQGRERSQEQERGQEKERGQGRERNRDRNE